RSLVGDEGVLEGQLVQAEGPAHVAQLGRPRLAQLDPDVVVAAALARRGLVDGHPVARLPHAARVVGAVDVHGSSRAQGWRATLRRASRRYEHAVVSGW